MSRLPEGPPMAIIAISQQLGSRGNDLGQLVARRLGYRFMSREDLIAQVSRVYKVTADQLVVLDERQPHFWSRLKTEGARFASFFRATLLREMAQDRLVTVSPSAPVFLPPYGCGLKVRVVGPFDDRVRLVGEMENLASVAAQRRVRDHDREVRARIQTLMGVDIEDPSSYDIVVNGYGAPLQIAAEGLATCAEQVDALIGAEQWQRMRDAATAAQVRAACHAHPKLGHAPIEVMCTQGAVQVRGPGLVPPWDELANQVASTVEGVRSVAVEADETPIPVRPD
jgi:cytidylate kinase